MVAALIVSFFPGLYSCHALDEGGNPTRAVFSCPFERSQDKNADRQPDAWRRRRDREHPSFIQSEITSRDAESFKKAKETEATLAKVFHAFQTGVWNPSYVPEVTPPAITALMDASLLNDCYEVRMDGGQYELVSPRFDVDTRFDYQLEAEIECQGLKQHFATVELRLFNAQGTLIGRYSTSPLSGTYSWQQLQTNDISITEDGRVRGEICLCVQSSSKKFGRGLARFDNVRLIRKPTLIVKSSVPSNIATPKSTVEFTCYAAGLSTEKNEVELTITDVDGREVTKKSLPLATSSDIDSTSVNLVKKSSRGTISTGEGRSKVVFPYAFDEAGLYYVQARLGGSQRRILVAVFDTVSNPKGPFGISLKSAPKLNEIPELTRIIQLAQMTWVKLPIWYDSEDLETAKATITFAKELKRLGVTIVGRLDRPPVSQFDRYDEDPSRTQSVTHLQDSTIWEPLLDPVLSEINTQIDLIQLGSDQDLGFAGSPNSAAILEKIRSVLQYYFQEPKLAVAADWLSPIVDSDKQAVSQYINAVHYSTQPHLTGTELKNYASGHNSPRVKLWTSLDPLSKAGYSLEDRVVDMLEKMIAVKHSGIQAAFSTTPFNDDTGLLDETMLPSEMLIPWARLAAALGSRKSIGAVEMPQRTQNITFQGEDSDVMILWGTRPVVEELFLGDDIKATDIWGRKIAIQELQTASGSRIQRIPIGKWPVLIDGVDSNVVRWRQEFQLLVDHLESHLSTENFLPIQLQNTLPKRAKGSLLISSPTLLRSGERPTALDIEVGRSEKIKIPLGFRSDASTGLHKLEFQFNIKADKDYSFSVHRDLKLGHPDIEFRWDLIRVNDEIVEAKVELLNKTTAPVDFDCTLFPPNQPYLRITLANSSPGATAKSLRLPVPKSVDGKNAPIWIRCEQIRSPLTLNYLVEEQSAATN